MARYIGPYKSHRREEKPTSRIGEHGKRTRRIREHGVLRADQKRMGFEPEGGPTLLEVEHAEAVSKCPIPVREEGEDEKTRLRRIIYGVNGIKDRMGLDDEQAGLLYRQMVRDKSAHYWTGKLRRVPKRAILSKCWDGSIREKIGVVNARVYMTDVGDDPIELEACRLTFERKKTVTYVRVLAGRDFEWSSENKTVIRRAIWFRLNGSV